MELQGIWAWPFSPRDHNKWMHYLFDTEPRFAHHLSARFGAGSFCLCFFFCCGAYKTKEQEGVWMQRAAPVDRPHLPSPSLPGQSLANFSWGGCSPCGWEKALPQAMGPWLRVTLFLLFTLRYWTLSQLLIIFQLPKTNEKVREVPFLSDPACQLLWLFINVGAGFVRFFLLVLKNKREISWIAEVI